MSVLMSGDNPVASDSARSTSSCTRRTLASMSIDRSADSGSAFTSAFSMPRSFWRNSARARATPSTRIRTPEPSGVFAICLMIATAPTRCRSSGEGSSTSPFCSRSRTMRSPASARLTASTEIGRLTPSGATVIGRTTASRRGTTGSSEGSGGGACGASSAMMFRH